MPLYDPEQSSLLIPSPLGDLYIQGSGEAISAVLFDARPGFAVNGGNPLLNEAAQQLTAYFEGTLRQFDLPLAPLGSPFQLQVWAELAKIPYGKTIAYMDIAVALGDKKTIRAVGAANGQNPIAIILPCHRVIGSNGALTGYAGGLWRKQWLLQHEARLAHGVLSLF